MNSRQIRKRSREFLREVLSILPAEYNAELTKRCFEQEREIQVLTNQLMKRDGYVIHSVDGREWDENAERDYILTSQLMKRDGFVIHSVGDNPRVRGE